MMKQQIPSKKMGTVALGCVGGWALLAVDYVLLSALALP